MLRSRLFTTAIVGALAWLWAVPACAGRVVDLAARAVPTVVGSHAEEQFGYATAAGDLNGDGTAGARRRRARPRGRQRSYHAGAVYVFDGRTVPGLTGQVGAPLDAHVRADGGLRAGPVRGDGGAGRRER